MKGKSYFEDLLERIDDVPDSVIELLKLSRAGREMFEACQKKLIKGLVEPPELHKRVNLLMTIPGVGEVTALTWALEIGDPHRFNSLSAAVSYCGLCSAQKESAGKDRRGPLSKDRNKHLQTILVEAANLAPRWNEELATVYTRELARGNKNRATLSVARKLVAYLLAVDKRRAPFEPRGSRSAA